MAAPKKLLDYLKPTIPMSGGVNMSIGGVSTPAALFSGGPNRAFSPTPAPAFAAPRTNTAPAPVAAPTPIAAAPVVPAPLPLKNPNNAAPAGGSIGTPVTPPTQTSVPPQWLRADGTIKTPEEIAADVGSSLKTAHGSADIGTLALGQFGGQDKSAVQLEAEARRVGNTRNDIAVGETDPYKVASQSGIAYTPAELNAIEKAYAGVYDPALDTALAKVTAKQESDKTEAAAKASQDDIRLRASLDAAQPYTLGKDQVRYGTNGEIIASGPSSTADTTATGPYVFGANPAVDAWAQRIFDGTAKITDIPAAQKGMRDAVVVALQASGNDLSGKPTITALGKQAKTEAQDLLDKFDARQGTSAVGGSRIFGGSLAIPGSDKADFQIGFQNLKDLLSLDGVKYLKGQGAVSDAERALLASAVTKLNLAQSDGNDGEFRKTLKGIIDQLSGAGESAAGAPISTPDGKQWTQNDDGSYTEISSSSLSNVGNTTASTKGNRPQRNNNPGNVKAGGLADSLATGRDDQNHLIFPSPEAGFKALTLDVTTKINGGSRYLPANPTIAQLGKVYAEDPNWPKKVAMMLGVGTDTSTKSVPLDKLVHAIATQEGFYA